MNSRKVFSFVAVLNGWGYYVSAVEQVAAASISKAQPRAQTNPKNKAAQAKVVQKKKPTRLARPTKPKARLAAIQRRGCREKISRLASSLSSSKIVTRTSSSQKPVKAPPQKSKKQFRKEVEGWVCSLQMNVRAPQKILVQVPDSHRLGVARELIEAKAYELAYEVLATHKETVEGDADRYLNLEHLAGVLALCRLRRPSLALYHFQNTARAATAPISCARTSFWLGQTYRELDEQTNGLHFLNAAARYPTTFYGQLAQVYLQRFVHQTPQVVVPTPTFRCTSFGVSPMQEQFLMNDIQRLFVTSPHPNPARDESVRQALLNYYGQLPDFGMKGTLIASLYSLAPYLRVRLYKQFFRDFHTPSVYGYPLLSEMFSVATLENFYTMISPSPWLYDWTVTLAHAIILHESEFNPFAVSCAGAQGMMQLMPLTAAKEHQHLVQGGVVTHDTKINPQLSFGNLMLGSAHLRTLEGLYGPNVFLVAAAYNAGAENTNKWLQIYGDPRKGEISTLEWIEMIPFRETRHYVQRVAEAFVVYSHLLGTEYLQELVWGLF